MGNQLVAYAPSLIRPVEFYLTDVPGLSFDTNLGSTRFLKVCRAKQGPVLVVVKVFVIHEHTLPIQIYCDRLSILRKSLRSSPSPNCLPFVEIHANERSVIVIRPYVKFSLYDRMSTRPFIQMSEKLWIAFQLLCGLVQLHKHNQCHGDLKLENLLITPGLRLLICDFAPFKPVYLPRNNPSAIFGFFFDTASRRCCYVAPERFHDDKSHLDNLLTQEDELRHLLLPSMDIFSAGCCLIELFTEGVVPFDLSQLLLFCSEEYDPTSVINTIENENVRDLVNSMIDRDPTKRLKAAEYLTKYRGILFPEVFYTTLQSYFDILAFQPLATPDSRMVRLHLDIKNLPDDPSLSLIFTSLVSAEVRGLRSTSAKLYALDSYKILSKKLSDESILERVIPYLIFLLHDQLSSRVRAESLSVLVDCLDYVTNIPLSDYNIFSGYIFPALEKLDRDVAVRVSLAKNLARLAQISSRYLESCFAQDLESRQLNPQFVNELHSHKEKITSFLSLLLTDTDSVVKRVLVCTPGSLTGLCKYFGKTKAHDILLSHLITFLNDKEDWHLRMAFFRYVPDVASFIGWHAAPLLIPLLKQGLADVEEFVMKEALIALKNLAEIRFFGHRFLMDLLEEVLPFVIHPNLWLRNACVGVITTIKLSLSEVDVHCHVIPRLKSYLNSTTNIWVVNEVSILNKVRKPFDRQVYESCSKAKASLLKEGVEFLQSTQGVGANPDSNEVTNFIKRLKAEGLKTPLDEVYVRFLLRHIVKVNAQRSLKNPMAATNFGISSKSTSGFSQAPLQSHLLIMSTPPLKELMYPYPGFTSLGSSSISKGFTSQKDLRVANKSPLPQNYAEFSEKPRGILVAHLHEHSSSILKITPLTSYKGIFATACRTDVRVWDAEKMEGRNVACRSRCQLKLPGDRTITNVAYGYGGNVIGITDEKVLYGYSVDNMVARPVFQCPINNQATDIGVPVSTEAYSPYLIVVGTELGNLIGFDTRISKEVFRLNSDLKSGLLCGLCVDEEQNWMCMGTSKGILTCWDLRFCIPVNIIKTDTPVRKLKPSSMHPGGVFLCPRNLNESSLWNLETGSRQISLWADPLAPLSKKVDSSNVPKASASMFGLAFVKSHNAVISAGSDMCLRWWDLTNPSDSYILAGLDRPEPSITGASSKHGDFRFRIVEGMEVIHDVTGVQNPNSKKIDLDSGSLGSSTSSGSSSNANSYHHSNSHHNVITDVATVATPNQSFILSSSADGVIKVWK